MRAQNNCITFIQNVTSVEDAGSTLYKCYANVLCLLWGSYFEEIELFVSREFVNIQHYMTGM